MGHGPMFAACAAFAAGCACLQTQAQGPDFRFLLFLPLSGAALWLWHANVRLERGRRLGVGVGVVVLAAVLGFFYAAWRAELRLAQGLDAAWEGRVLGFTGRVVGLPEVQPGGMHIVMASVHAQTPGFRPPAQVRLGWYARPGQALPEVRGGDCLRVQARLNSPWSTVNPAGFDYQAWLLERGIVVSGGVHSAQILPSSACAGGARAWLDRWRGEIRARLQAALGDAPYAGVVVALAVGEQAAIPAAQWRVFRLTGTTHLFSVSGLHITLFASLVFALTNLLWRRFPRLSLRVPARRAAIVPGMLAATGYALLSGFGLPAQRTLFMLLTAGSAALLLRRMPPSGVLAVALFVVVLIDPWAALSPGFWLSFAAVALLLWSAAGRITQVPWWRQWLHVQAVVTLGLLPLLLALFHEVSWVSPLANAFAIPVISLLAAPLSLLAAIGPGVAWLAHACVQGVMLGLNGLSAWPQAAWHGASPSWGVLLLSLVGTGVLLLPRGFPGRWLGALLFLPLLFPRLVVPMPGEAWLTVLDVGQGEALVVRTAHHTLLLDSGPRFSSGEDAGARIVAPWLWAQGITQVTGLVLSHDDLDHSGGVAALLESHRPDWVLTPLAGQDVRTLGQAGQHMLARRPDALTCRAGLRWQWDGVAFSVLHPPMHQFAMRGYGDNDRGCVVRVDAGGKSALLSADIESLSERNLAERGVLAPVDVLVVPHHGSRSSSSLAFLRALQPQWAVIPVGHRNRYGHPHGEVLARYRDLGIPVWRTDREGAVTVKLSGAGVEVESARRAQPRYWLTPPAPRGP